MFLAVVLIIRLAAARQETLSNDLISQSISMESCFHNSVHYHFKQANRTRQEVKQDCWEEFKSSKVPCTQIQGAKNSVLFHGEFIHSHGVFRRSSRRFTAPHMLLPFLKVVMLPVQKMFWWGDAALQEGELMKVTVVQWSTTSLSARWACR